MRDASEVVALIASGPPSTGIRLLKRDRISAKLEALAEFSERAAEVGRDDLPRVMVALMADLAKEANAELLS